MNGWNEVHNAQLEYLNSKIVPIITGTFLTDKSDPVFSRMIKWCEKSQNIKGSWGVEQQDDAPINFKFWHTTEAKKFIKRFKKYIDTSETMIS